MAMRATSHPRPSFKKLWEVYPDPPSPGQHAHPSNDPYPNQCAIRLSVALSKTGWDFSDYKMGPLTSEGWPRGAKSLADYLELELFRPKKVLQDEFEKTFKASTGIMFLAHPADPNAADHIDLWDRGKPRDGYYKAAKVWFWSLE